ncbi:hypothetical protein [Kribbella sp. CA-293567]|uniref:hypothetical protein n=1 Tax=Kribbella sp. CA-293567 TaxID=3002436 RepID=UPI0022DD19B9|nr:hypothetical protein [Kribbella sp. CA-293567]WBQ03028.1 hypothetical protein OX958_23960 [Kribbella sp. CA-293567]
MPMPDEAQVDLNGLQINNGPDADGVTVTCSKITGWGVPAPTGGGIQRSGTDGGTSPTQWTGPRLVTITGQVQAPTRELREAAVDDFNARVDLDLFPLRITETKALQTLARQNSAVEWNDDTDVLWSYSAELYCPDSTRYGVIPRHLELRLPSSTGGLRVPIRVPIRVTGTSQTGDGAEVNAGNKAVFPTIRFDGPCSHPSLTNVTTSRSLTYKGDLGVGEFVEISTKYQSALLMGTASRGGLVGGEFWAIAPKTTNTIAFRAASGTTAALATVDWLDGYR